jgi:hypothetical protein
MSTSASTIALPPAFTTRALTNRGCPGVATRMIGVQSETQWRCR